MHKESTKAGLLYTWMLSGHFAILLLLLLFVSSIFLLDAHCQCLLFNSFLLYCFPRWVKRDSYLPVGSQNLKATTKVGIYRYFVRAVIKSWRPEISPGYYEYDPLLLSLENRRYKRTKINLSNGGKYPHPTH